MTYYSTPCRQVVLPLSWKECTEGHIPVVEIRRLAPQYIEAIVAIEQQTNPSPWSEKQFRAELENPASYFDVLLSDDRVAAFICAWVYAGEMQIQDLATAPDQQRKGYAARLLENSLFRAIKKRVGKAFLEVRKGNRPALELYRKFGFVVSGVRPGYYPDNEDAILMELEIMKREQLSELENG